MTVAVESGARRVGRAGSPGRNRIRSVSSGRDRAGSAGDGEVEGERREEQAMASAARCLTDDDRDVCCRGTSAAVPTRSPSDGRSIVAEKRHLDPRRDREAPAWEGVLERSPGGPGRAGRVRAQTATRASRPGYASGDGLVS